MVDEIADSLNAAIYAARGDYTNAALSAAAMIPIAGWAATGAKLGVKVTREVAKLSTNGVKLANHLRQLENTEKQGLKY